MGACTTWLFNEPALRGLDRKMQNADAYRDILHSRGRSQLRVGQSGLFCLDPYQETVNDACRPSIAGSGQASLLDISVGPTATH